jgi:hypothetical protein
MSDQIQEVIVDGEIMASNISDEYGRSIKDRAFKKDAKTVSFVYNRGTHTSTYTFKNVNNFKDNRDE